MKRIRSAAGGALAAVILCLAGCEAGKADVTGKVTYQGKPVVWGTVIVQGPDGVAVNGTIAPDGTYAVRGVTAGPAKLGVVSRNPGVRGMAVSRGGRGGKEEGAAPAAPLAAGPEKGKWFPLPPAAEDPEKSGLTANFGGGSNAHDIELK